MYKDLFYTLNLLTFIKTQIQHHNFKEKINISTNQELYHHKLSQ